MPRHTVKLVAVAVALALGLRAAAGEAVAKRGLPRLEALARTVLILKDGYADPKRLEPRKILVAALVRVSDAVDPLIVEGGERSEKLTLRMAGEAKELELAAINSVWDLHHTLGEALEFVSERTTIEPRTLEYAAIHGMLSTLGPKDALLTPEMAKELKKTVRGEFASLGLVSGIRGEKLTVVKVLPDTPAQRIGLARGDVITEIDGRSTAGRDLQQIADWMRGTKGSEITVGWTRAGGPPQRAKTRRQVVDIPLLAAQALLPERVAYVRLSHFGDRTVRDLRRALQVLRGSDPAPLRGVVLDLRNNPGGLLDQAIAAADLFLSHGDILEIEPAAWETRMQATPGADDVTAPVVVLVNHFSAGASEIVAAALRENGRAVIVGQRTFGLGSFQQLEDVEDRTPEKPAPATLKYTAGRYRVAGGRTFDNVGLVPDVVVQPGWVARDAITFFAPRASPSGAAPAEEPKPLGTITYLIKEGALQSAPESLEPEGEEERDPAHDPLVAFAAQVLARAKSPDRDGLLAAATEVLPEQQAAEQDRLADRVAALGNDWTKAPSDASPKVKVTLAPLPRPVPAGGRVPWTITVENLGPGPLSRLRAWTVAPQAPHLDRLELLFGTLPAGAKRSAAVQISPDALVTGAEPVTIHFEEENGHAPADVAARFDVASIARPSVSARLTLTCAAKECGPLDEGVVVKVEAVVRNAGASPAGAGAALALISPDERVYVTEPRAAVGPVAPGAEREAVLGFRLVAGSGGDAIPVQVRFENAGLDRTTCDLDLKRGEELPLTRECHPVQLRLTPDPDAAPLAIDGDRLSLVGTGSITGGDRLRRVVITLNGRKAFSQAASDETPTSIDFTASLPLQPGSNALGVTAETIAGKAGYRVFKVQRR